jgi:hypothetical protein
MRVKKASAAESALLKALGITSPNLSATDEDLRTFSEIFDSPLKENQLRAIASIFGKSVPIISEQQVEVCQRATVAH